MKETSAGFIDRGYPVTEATLYIYCDACGSFNIRTYIPFTKLLVIGAILLAGALLAIRDRQWLMCLLPPAILSLMFLPWQDLLLRYKCRTCGNVKISDFNSRNYEPYDTSRIDVADRLTQKRYVDTENLQYQRFT